MTGLHLTLRKIIYCSAIVVARSYCSAIVVARSYCCSVVNVQHFNTVQRPTLKHSRPGGSTAESGASDCQIRSRRPGVRKQQPVYISVQRCVLYFCVFAMYLLWRPPQIQIHVFGVVVARIYHLGLWWENTVLPASLKRC